MIDFTCECGRALSVVSDLGGWTTKCPGCHQSVAVPQVSESAAPPPRALPWKGIAIGASAVAAIAIAVAALSGGGSAPKQDIDEVARLKVKLESRDQELSMLQEERARHGDPAKMAERLRAAEAERDRLKKALEVAELTGRGGPREPEKPAAPAPTPPPAAPVSPEPAAPPPAVAKPIPEDLKAFAGIVERCGPTAVLIRTDRGLGSGFFVTQDGLIATTYQVVAQSTSCKVTYIEVKGAERTRVEVDGQAVAVDQKNNLALVQIVVRRLLTPATLDQPGKLRVADEVLVLGPPAPDSRETDCAPSKARVNEIELVVAGTKCIEIEAAIQFESSGTPIFSKEGKVVGVATVVSGVAATAGCAIWASYVQQLMDNRETIYSVRGNLAAWEQKQGLKSTRDVSRGIKVDASLTKFHLDEDRDRIVGLDPRNRILVTASISKQRVVKTVPIGAGATDFQLTSSPDFGWVCFPDARTFLKVDLVEGKVYDRVDVPLTFDRFVATRSHLWTYAQRSLLINLKDKKAVPSPLKFGALAHDRRRGRLVGIVNNWDEQKFIEFDPDKVGPKLLEFAEIDSAGATGPRWKDREDLRKEILGMLKSWPIPPEYGAWSAIAHTFTLIADGGARVYLNQAVMRQDKLDSILGFVRPEPHTRLHLPEVLEGLRYIAYPDQIQAGSPDGKWIANATHIYEGERFMPHKEIPIPSRAMAFSRDSKTLYIWDVTNRMILPVDVQSKEK